LDEKGAELIVEKWRLFDELAELFVELVFEAENN
jgi:hypothetical protein